MMDVDVLIPFLTTFVSKTVEETGDLGTDLCDYEITPSTKDKLRRYLSGKLVDEKDIQSLSEEIVDEFYDNDSSYEDNDNDDEEEDKKRTFSFKKCVAKTKSKMEYLHSIACNTVTTGKVKVKRSEEDMGNGNLISRVAGVMADDGKEVALRMGAAQLAKAVREPLTAMLISGLQLEDNDSSRSRVVGFLNSEIGLGLVSLVCSMGVKALPLPEAAQDVLAGLSRELRVQSEMAVATPVVELLAAPMRALLTEQVLALPIPGLKPAPQLVTSNPVVPAPVTVVKVEAETKKPVKKKTQQKTPAKKSAVKVVPKTTPSPDRETVTF